jgi:hypothetical protein
VPYVQHKKSRVAALNLAKMLGNPLMVCEKHYGQWAPGRQQLLDKQAVGIWTEESPATETAAQVNRRAWFVP